MTINTTVIKYNDFKAGYLGKNLSKKCEFDHQTLYFEVKFVI